MTKLKGKKEQLNIAVDAIRHQVVQPEHAIKVQKQLAFASGIFQKDVTVRTLLESVAEGVIVCDKDGVIVLINHRAGALFGLCQL